MREDLAGIDEGRELDFDVGGDGVDRQDPPPVFETRREGIATVEPAFAETAQGLRLGEHALVAADAGEAPERHALLSGHVAKRNMTDQGRAWAEVPQMPGIQTGHAVEIRIQHAVPRGNTAEHDHLTAAARNRRIVAGYFGPQGD